MQRSESLSLLESPRRRRYGNPINADGICSTRAQIIRRPRGGGRWRATVQLCAVLRSLRPLVERLAAAWHQARRPGGLYRAEHTCPAGIVLRRAADRLG